MALAASNFIIIQRAEKKGKTLTFIESALVGVPLTVLNILVYRIFLTVMTWGGRPIIHKRSLLGSFPGTRHKRGPAFWGRSPFFFHRLFCQIPPSLLNRPEAFWLRRVLNMVAGFT